MSLYTCIQALITCTLIYSNSFSSALLTSSKLYLLIDFSSVGDHLIRLCVLLCLYPLCTPVLSLYWCDLGMSKPSPFFVCKECGVCISVTVLAALPLLPCWPTHTVENSTKSRAPCGFLVLSDV